MSTTYAESLRIAMNCAVCNPSPLLERTYSIEEAANIAGCDTDTLAARANNGEVPGIKWGRGWRYPALTFHLALNHAAIERMRKLQTPGATGAVGKPQAPAANDPAPAGRRKPRTAPVLPDLKTAT